MNKLLAIVGPTAVGKTKYSILLAEKLNGEIISGDSMQIYKHMNIGTAKVTPEEMNGIKHHLIDIQLPNEPFSAAKFKNEATKAYIEIIKRNRLPIIAGGTGLYVNGFLYDYTFSETQENYSLRQKLEEEANSLGLDKLYERLISIDISFKEKISKNDKFRIIRALEIYDSTNLAGKLNENMKNNYQSKFNLVYIGFTLERSILYKRINERVDIMIELGLLDEVKNLLNMGYSPKSIALQGIGYKELIMYLEKKLSLTESIDLIKQKSRNFAKRQLTWFKRDPNIYWIDLTEKMEYDVIDEIISYTHHKWNHFGG